MDLRQLRYFTIVADHQHFGRAASVLNVAQPALSRQIRILEEELGVRLFLRHARGATPTEEGLFLQERSVYLLRYVEQLKQDMLARRSQPQGPVALGLSPGLAQLVAVPLIKAVRAGYPNVQLKLVEEFSPSLNTMLLQGDVDLAILFRPVLGADLTLEPLVVERICLIGRPNDLRRLPARLQVKHLAGLPLVLTGIAKSGVRLQVETAAARAGVTLNVIVEVESMPVAKQLMEEGIGLTVQLTAAVRKEIAAGTLAARPIEGLQLRRVLARSSVRPMLSATSVVIDVLQKVVGDLVDDSRWLKTGQKYR